MRDAPSIMVVDQDPLTVRKVVRAMENYGPVVSSYSSLELAVDALAQGFVVDVIIINLERPFKMAFELLTLMKASSAQTEVVFVSIFDDVSLWLETIQRGAYDFLVKPLDASELKRILIQAIEKNVAVAVKKDPVANPILARAAIVADTSLRSHNSL